MIKKQYIYLITLISLLCIYVIFLLDIANDKKNKIIQSFILLTLISFFSVTSAIVIFICIGVLLLLKTFKYIKKDVFDFLNKGVQKNGADS